MHKYQIGPLRLEVGRKEMKQVKQCSGMLVLVCWCSLFFMYLLISDTCFSLSELLHSVWQTVGPSTSKQNRKESCKKQESHGKFPGLEVRHEGGDNDGYSFFNTYYPSGIMISICISCLFELSLLFHKRGSVLSRQPRWDEKRPREVKQLAQRYTVNLAVCVVVGWGEICCLSSGLSSWLLSHPLLWGATKILSGKLICWTLGSLSSAEWPWSLT